MWQQHARTGADKAWKAATGALQKLKKNQQLQDWHQAAVTTAREELRRRVRRTAFWGAALALGAAFAYGAGSALPKVISDHLAAQKSKDGASSPARPPLEGPCQDAAPPGERVAAQAQHAAASVTEALQEVVEAVGPTLASIPSAIAWPWSQSGSASTLSEGDQVEVEDDDPFEGTDEGWRGR